jgi:hypothetical protein
MLLILRWGHWPDSVHVAFLRKRGQTKSKGYGRAKRQHLENVFIGITSLVAMTINICRNLPAQLGLHGTTRKGRLYTMLSNAQLSVGSRSG